MLKLFAGALRGFLFLFGAVIPFCAFLIFATQEYDRDTASFSSNGYSISRLLDIAFQMPETVMLGDLAFFGIYTTLTALIFAFIFLSMFVWLGKQGYLSISVLALTISFLISPISKAYAFYSVFGAGGVAVVYYALTLFVFFMAPIVISLQTFTREMVDSSNEYLSSFQRVRFYLRSASASCVLGALVCFSVVFYSGDELNFLTRGIESFGQFVMPMQMVRDTELGLLCAALFTSCAILASAGSYTARRIWGHSIRGS